jgi:hypothetical protein
MRNLVYTLFILSLFGQGTIFAQQFEWVNQKNSDLPIEAMDVLYDGSNNIITLESNDVWGGNSRETFITKRDTSGAVDWTIDLYEFIGNAISQDADGNIYIIGTFFNVDSIDFDPSGDSLYLRRLDGEGVIAKYSNSAQLIWAKQFDARPYDLVVRGDEIYLSGNFIKDYADINPDLSVYDTLTNNGAAFTSDFFIAKLDTAANYLWAKSLGGTGNEVPSNLKLDYSGNVLLTGSFENTIDLDPGVGVSQYSTPSNKYFILKLDGNGDYIWSRAPSFSGGYLWDLEIGLDNAIYSTGVFSGIRDFDYEGATVSIASNGGTDIYVHKMDSTGSFVWVKQIGGPNSEFANALHIDGNGNFFISGTFRDTVDFDWGSGQTLEGTAMDIGFCLGNFIMKVNANETFAWVNTYIGDCMPSSLEVRDLTTDVNGDLYVVGGFVNEVDFDPGNTGTTLISNLGGQQSSAFYLKLGGQVSAVNQLHTNEFSYYPNPVNNTLNIELENIELASVRLFNTQGQMLQQIQNINSNLIQLEMDVAAGLYFVEIETNRGEKETIKVIKQ